MDVLMLSRLQFAMATAFHFLFVPLTLGLGVLIAIMETKYVRTGDEKYKRMAKFWGKMFFLNFAIGVVTGITLEFQFGTNWARYSAFVGDVFGSLLAIEATTSFFLESTFIAVWFFGWGLMSRKAHCIVGWLVAIGANVSGFWILVANSWMHHPVGFEIQQKTVGGQVMDVAVLTNFREVVFNPYAINQFFHTISSAFVFSGFVVMGISAWHLLKKSNVEFFRKSFGFGLGMAAICIFLSVAHGHHYAAFIGKESVQPAKLAAMEAQWETVESTPFKLFAIPDTANRKNSVEFIKIPGAVSMLTHHDFKTPVKGLKEFIVKDPVTGKETENFPPVALTFYSFRTMVGIGFLMLAMMAFAFWKRKTIENYPRFLKAMVLGIPLPMIAIQAGWIVTEVGRQPFVVYPSAAHPGMRTAEAFSQNVATGEVWFSLVTMVLMYTVVGIIGYFLMTRFAKQGPQIVDKYMGAGAADEKGGE